MHGYPATDNCACGKLQYEFTNKYCYDGSVNGCGVYRDPDGACVQCEAYKTLNAEGKCQCSTNTYPYGSECRPCPDNCATCSNQFQCTSCKATFTINYPLSWQCNCVANEFLNSQGQCEQCPSGCASCTNATHCTSCQNTYSMTDAHLCECAENAYLSNGACVLYNSCVRGTYNNRVDNTCEDCPLVDFCAECGWVNDEVKCKKCEQTFTLNQTIGDYGECACGEKKYLTD